MGRFRVRPAVVEARQLVGSEDGNAGRELAAWCGGWIGGSFDQPRIGIDTPEGGMTARCGDWIIRRAHGEFYPCRDDVFRLAYEEVSNAPQEEE